MDYIPFILNLSKAAAEGVWTASDVSLLRKSQGSRQVCEMDHTSCGRYCLYFVYGSGPVQHLMPVLNVCA